MKIKDLPIWLADFLFGADFVGVSLSFALVFPDCNTEDDDDLVLFKLFVTFGLPSFRFSIFFEELVFLVETVLFNGVFDFLAGVPLLLEVLLFITEFLGFVRTRFCFDEVITFSNSVGFSNNSWWYFSSSTALVKPAVFLI